MRRALKGLVGLVVAAVAALGHSDDGVANRIARLEQGLHELADMDLRHLFEFGEGNLGLEERMRHHKVPGLSLAVISDFAIDWYETWGVREVGTGRSVDTKTIFEAASASKLVTAVLALMLVDEGKLSLDAPVDRSLERWKIPESELTRRHSITLRRLLTHTAGINRPESMFFFEPGTRPTLIDVLNGRRPAINDAVAVEYEPGARHQYSNLGYDVIQLLIEEVTGRGLEEVMKIRVFEPLGMSSCTYEFPFSTVTDGRVARPHDGELTPAMNDLHPSALAHGGLLCTAEDLAKLTVELMNTYRGAGGRLMSTEMMRQMLSIERELDDEAGGLNGQGLGAFLLTDGSQLYFAHHGYNTPGTCALVFANPASGDGVVAMANGANGFELIFEVLAGLIDLYDWPAVVVD